MQKKRLFFAGAVVCLLVAGWAYYQYQKPRAGVSAATPEYTLTAEKLYAAYITNETDADRKYRNKVLQVSGVVRELQTAAHTTNILLAAGSVAGGVNCSFQNDQKINVTIGRNITVKGRCAGFLLDVSLVDAVRTDGGF